MWKKLDKILKKADGVMITSPHNLRYFSGFSGGEGVCLIGRDFKYLFVDSRYTIAAKSEVSNFTVIEFGGGMFLDEIKSKIDKNSIKVLAFEDRNITVSTYNRYKEKLTGIEFVGVSEELADLRMIKTEEELSFLRQAEKIGDTAFTRVLPMIKVGVTECEIAAELEHQMRKCGAEGTSFETIVVSGAKSGMPHGKPDNKKLDRGDFVTMDFGCIYRGYCSDMTRTVIMDSASEEQMRIYNTVLKAQRSGLESIRAGIKGCDADFAARNVIKDDGYGEFFGHSLGHGVGLLIHELPNLSPMSQTVLKENMVVTCEPGIYIEGLGGVRIEDMVVVKKGGIENLTSSPKEPIICG